jgi:hypothetical protein
MFHLFIPLSSLEKASQNDFQSPEFVKVYFMPQNMAHIPCELEKNMYSAAFEKSTHIK